MSAHLFYRIQLTNSLKSDEKGKKEYSINLGEKQPVCGVSFWLEAIASRLEPSLLETKKKRKKGDEAVGRARILEGLYFSEESSSSSKQAVRHDQREVMDKGPRRTGLETNVDTQCNTGRHRMP